MTVAIACIAGSIVEAYYGIKKDLKEKALSYLDEQLLKIVNEFEEAY